MSSLVVALQNAGDRISTALPDSFVLCHGVDGTTDAGIRGTLV